MKYLIVAFVTLCAVSSRAQITLEHKYNCTSTETFSLVQVDSAEWKYMHFNGRDSISVYNIDHSLDRVIIVPWQNSDKSRSLTLLAKGLFSLDGSYAYMLQGPDTTSSNWNRMVVINERGDSLFYCDSCTNATDFGLSGQNHFIQSTSSGTKMIIRRSFQDRYEVYSLPGKLAICAQTLGVNDPSNMITSAQIPTSAYPNPTSGRVRIAYELPPGVSSGELVLTSEDGRELKHYRVTNAFNDLLIEASDLPSGSYFYKLVTEKGESPVRTIALIK